MGRLSGLKADGYRIGRCEVGLLVCVCDQRLSDPVFGFSDPEALGLYEDVQVGTAYP